MADIFRAHGHDYAAQHALTPGQGKVLRAVQRCRTAALGGHVDTCDHCGFTRPAYNSCRDRHCPSCQAPARYRWLEQRMERVLPTHHFHVVFTLPEDLRPLALRNPETVYGIVFAAASETLDTLGRQRLGARIGATLVLHTWTRKMLFHPHVHCVVTGGGVAEDGHDSWAPTPRRFLFPVAVMRKLFRGIVHSRLRKAYDDEQLDLDGCCEPFREPKAFAKLLRGLHRKKWVVYAKEPFAGAEQVFAYLGRYTHRVAISDLRLVTVSDQAVTFTTKNGGTVSVTPDEFIRRFLLHVLPPGFHKIRHYGLYSSAHVKRLLPVARTLLPSTEPAPKVAAFEDGESSADATAVADEPASRTCPRCGHGVLIRLVVPAIRCSRAAALEPYDTS